MPNDMGDITPVSLKALSLQRQGQLADLMTRRGAAGQDDAKLKQTAHDFEAILLNRLVSEMRKSVPKGGILERSMAREWFEQMFDEEIAKEMSQSSNLGIADALYQQMRGNVSAHRPGQESTGKPASPTGAPQRTDGGDDAPPASESPK